MVKGSSDMDDLIDFKKLRMFVTTVKEGSMRQASHKLFVTPSALSHGIRAMEEAMETQFFERNGPNLKPTREGLLFYEEAQDLLNRLDTVANKFSKGSRTAHDELRIGTTNAGCLHLFPGILREFRESHPQVALRLEISDTDHLIESMRDGKLDIVIAPVQRDYEGFVQQEIGKDQLVYVVHPAHSWAQNGAVDLKNLAQEKLIAPPVGSHTYRLIDSYYREQRIPLEPFIEVNSEEAIKQLASLNIGVGIVPGWIAREEISKGSLVSFSMGSKPMMRRWMVLYREQQRLDFPNFLFIGMTQAVAENLLH